VPAAPTSMSPADDSTTTAETHSAGQKGCPGEPGVTPGAASTQERP
jgi:hypothetical protein